MTAVSTRPPDFSAHVPHPLHSGERTWTETNCYVDLWIELLHGLGLDPLAACAFTLSTDFEGDQWEFFKFPPEDLRTVYGIEVHEINVWRPVIEHVEEQLALGRLLTVEVDAWHLPDTAGVSYQREHVKTTIVPWSLDRAGRRLGYLHNAGRYELAGADFDGALHVDPPVVLAPYVELVRLERVRRDPVAARAAALLLTREHLARRPADNPVGRLAARMESDLPGLAGAGEQAFHEYAFATCRQLGANAELAASYATWLGDCPDAVEHLIEVATTAKSLQFTLARAARGRSTDLAGQLARMGTSWEAAGAALMARHGH